MNGAMEPRQKTFPYFSTLPYPIESAEDRLANLNVITGHLCLALAAEDWPRAIYWNSELRDWMALKFVLPKAVRIRLIQVYYEVITAFGVDPRAHARFMSMFLELTKYAHRASHAGANRKASLLPQWNR